MLDLTEALEITLEEKHKETEAYIKKSIIEAKKRGEDTVTVYCERFPNEIAEELKRKGQVILSPILGTYLISCL